MNTLTTTQILWFTLAIIWSMVWKYWALWRSARKDDRSWFLVFCVVNTLGILEILYIYVFSRPKTQE